MARNPLAACQPDSLPASFPLEPDAWAHVVETLGLPPQQARIVAHLLLGMRDKEIAAAMGISKPTLRTYFSRIFDKLHARDRIEVVVRVFSAARRRNGG